MLLFSKVPAQLHAQKKGPSLPTNMSLAGDSGWSCIDEVATTSAEEQFVLKELISYILRFFILTALFFQSAGTKIKTLPLFKVNSTVAPCLVTKVSQRLFLVVIDTCRTRNIGISWYRDVRSVLGLSFIGYDIWLSFFSILCPFCFFGGVNDSNWISWWPFRSRRSLQGGHRSHHGEVQWKYSFWQEVR